jgi:hypothetical protein
MRQAVANVNKSPANVERILAPRLPLLRLEQRLAADHAEDLIATGRTAGMIKDLAAYLQIPAPAVGDMAVIAEVAAMRYVYTLEIGVSSAIEQAREAFRDVLQEGTAA